MKITTASLAWLVLSTGAFASDGMQIGNAAPQPRVRLSLSPIGTIAPAEPAPKVEADTVVLDKFIVGGPSVAPPSRAPIPEPKKFSLLNGGPLMEGRVGAFPLVVGAWAWTDISLPEDAQFKPQRIQADVEFFKLKL